MMDLHRQGEATVADILTEVQNLADENGADLADLECDYVDIDGNDLGDCGDAVPAAASGVRVAAVATKDTAFVRVFGIDDFTATADATAQVLSVREVDPADVPFLLCGFDPSSPDTGLVLWDPVLNDWVLNDTWVSDASGPWLTIHAPQVDDCGAASNGFKGWADPDAPGVVDDWWQTQPGNRAGPARAALADPVACEDGELDDCTIVVPVCMDGQGAGTNVELLCVEFAAFYVERVRANEHRVRLVDTTPRILEGGAGGPARPDGARIIQLTE
jgi:hypothetical protein